MRQIILTASYWLTLRPLATYPGPFLAKVCDAYSAYHGWNQSTHLDALRRHETYGWSSLLLHLQRIIEYDHGC